ncbi:MAG TPA: transcription termination/antitermination NusG family protein [Nitrospiraceae bacterium]|nr:transcription termination/antitermination NusG family protein [Nitrospiraceae bacterium]
MSSSQARSAHADRQVVRAIGDAPRARRHFLPTIRRWSRWRDRRKLVEWPPFPGYCFVRLDGVHTLPTLRCAGVLSIVSVRGKPVSIATREVDSLRLLVRSTVDYDACPVVSEGATIEVVRGKLHGITGRLLHRSSNRATVVLSVDLINRAARVEVGADDIEFV